METPNLEQENKQVEPKKNTSSGLDENLAGALCYVFGFVTGIVFLVIEKENKFIKFHAIQSTIISAVIILLNFVLGFIPILGWLLSLLLAPAGLIIWILCIYNAYQGKWFELPLIGKIAKEQTNN